MDERTLSNPEYVWLLVWLVIEIPINAGWCFVWSTIHDLLFYLIWCDCARMIVFKLHLHEARRSRIDWNRTSGQFSLLA